MTLFSTGVGAATGTRISASFGIRRRGNGLGAGVRLTVGVRRRGVTLFELLVVLVLMTISAALVWPAISSVPDRLVDSEAQDPADVLQRQAGQATPLPDAAVDPVLTSARRAAIKRGEPVRVRVERDGVWAIVSVKGGLAIETGRVAMELAWLPDVVVDALGTCLLSPNVSRPAGAQSWDALACRWRGAR